MGGRGVEGQLLCGMMSNIEQQIENLIQEIKKTDHKIKEIHAQIKQSNWHQTRDTIFFIFLMNFIFTFLEHILGI